MKSSGRKRKDEGYFSILYGGVPLRVSILKENTEETYIRSLCYSLPRKELLLSSAKGASLRCRKKQGFQGNVRKQARASLKERLLVKSIRLCAYMFNIRQCESKKELPFIFITRVPQSYHLLELSSQKLTIVKIPSHARHI